MIHTSAFLLVNLITCLMTTLRNRRKLPKERLAMEEKESESLIQDEERLPDEFARRATDGYILVPLKQRHVFCRLDVWPFMFCYLALMMFDIWREKLDSSFALIPQVLFPLALLCHVTLFLLCQWDVFWRAAVGYQRLSMRSAKSTWTHCIVEAPHIDKHHSAHDAGIVQIQRQNGIVVCRFQDVVFRCANQENDTDVTLWDADRSTENVDQEGNSFHRLRYPINLSLSFYRNWMGHASLNDLVEASSLFGRNSTPIESPPFLEMLQEQLVAPFFLFQLGCCCLWCLDEYWYYAVFTLFALIMFESTVAYNRLKSLERLRAHTISKKNEKFFVYRPVWPGKSDWTSVYAEEILPGDIISCKEVSGGSQMKKDHHTIVPADMLLCFGGQAVVDESLLTGESVPQLKTSLEDNSTDRNLDMQEHKQSICFGGTKLLVTHEETHSRIPAAPDRGVIGVTLRTGFETAQGSLLRTMAHTQKSVDGIHTMDTYIFIFLLLLCAVVSAYMVWEEGWADESRNKFRLTLHIIMIVTSVVPPELPMELSLAVTNSVADLMKRCQVYCTEIFRIPIAGQVNVCCFDKTGTLTSDEMQLKGVRLVDPEDSNSFSEVMKPDGSLPWQPTLIMAACHALALGGNGSNNVIGDPLEKAIVDTTGYRMVKRNEMKREAASEDHATKIQIVQRFNFTSRLKRMSVLARTDSHDTVWALTKGAPEVIKDLLKEGSCPGDYDKVSMYHMGRGQRVLAMAYRRVSVGQERLAVQDLKRENVESDLIFAGFLLLDCPIKGDSKSVIQELQSSGHQVKMITGDSLWTAAEVARQVGIVQKRNGSFPEFFQLRNCEDSDAADSSSSDVLGKFRFVQMIPDSIEGSKDVDVSVAASDLERLIEMVAGGDASLCMSGDTLQDLVNSLVFGTKPGSGSSENSKGEDKNALFDPVAQETLKGLVPLVSVFARHAPRQKEAIVAALNLGGNKTLMCGDGTNDMASLRRAHVGISIISAPEVEAKQRSAASKLSAARAYQKKEMKKKSKTKSNPPMASLEESLNQLRQAQEELNSVELGDASIASPFTSRSISIKCCKDVLQQGRCTLVTMLQIYKILGINCLVNAMVLSNLFLHGVKQGDRQLTCTGLAVAALFLFVTRGKPLDSISPVRPPASVLCLSALASIALQFGIHFWAIRLATQVSLSFVDPYDPSMIPDGNFNPNTLNTSAFLMNLLATVNTFAANYPGEPFVEPLRKNTMLLRSLQGCYTVLLCCGLELFPPLSDLLQLSEYPSIESDEPREWQKETLDEDLILSLANGIVSSFGFPAFICGLMVVDTLLTFAVEKCLLWYFNPVPTGTEKYKE